jgi:hypothetical protein
LLLKRHQSILPANPAGDHNIREHSGPCIPDTQIHGTQTIEIVS